MYRYNRSCGCSNMMNNNGPLETSCSNVLSTSDANKNECQCGFNNNNNGFPTNPMLGQSYVPIQTMDKTFTPYCGLKNGTIFPELVSPYYPCQSIEDNEYIRSRNTIGKGCNA